MKLIASLSLLLSTALIATASPIDSAEVLPAAVGPSGSLSFPPGGTVFPRRNHGNLRLSYNQVSQSNAQTQSIDVQLEPANGGAAILVANGVTVDSNTAPITLFDATTACGDFNLAITEHQILNSNPISFRAAAPRITLQC